MASRRAHGPGISFFAFQDIITAVVGIFILITLILVLELAQRVEAATSGEHSDIAPIVDAIDALDEEVKRLREMLQSRSRAENQLAEVNAFSRDEQVESLRNQLAASKNRLAQLNAQIERLRSEQRRAEDNAKTLASESLQLEDERDLIEELAAKMRALQAKINQLSGDTSPIFRDVAEDGRFVTLVVLDGTTIDLRDALTQSSRSFQGGRRVEQTEAWMKSVSLGQRQFYILVKPGGASDFTELRELLDRVRAAYGYNVVGVDSELRLGFEVE